MAEVPFPGYFRVDKGKKAVEDLPITNPKSILARELTWRLVRRHLATMGCSGSKSSLPLNGGPPRPSQQGDPQEEVAHTAEVMEEMLRVLLVREMKQHSEHKDEVDTPRTSMFKAESAALRRLLLASSIMIKQTTEHLEALAVEQAKHMPPERGSSRSGFLLTISEQIGPPPSDRKWRDEWVDLNEECARIRGWDKDPNNPWAKDREGARKMTAEGKFSYENKLKTYDHQVQFKVKQVRREPAPIHPSYLRLLRLLHLPPPSLSLPPLRSQMGWALEDAQAHTCIAGVCGIVVTEHLREKSNKFAATTYALYDALARGAKLAAEPPPVIYALLHGKFGGLTQTTDKRCTCTCTCGAHAPTPHPSLAP